MLRVINLQIAAAKYERRYTDIERAIISTGNHESPGQLDA